MNVRDVADNSCFGGAVDIIWRGTLVMVASETTLINPALVGEAGKTAPCFDGANVSQGWMNE